MRFVSFFSILYFLWNKHSDHTTNNHTFLMHGDSV